MSERVVDELELVEVHEQHCGPGGGRPGQIGEHPEGLGAIHQPGERILRRGAGQRGHVPNPGDGHLRQVHPAGHLPQIVLAGCSNLPVVQGEGPQNAL